MAYTLLHNTGTTLELNELIEVRHKVLRYRSTKTIAQSNFPGQRRGTRRGQGLDFIDLRQYNAGDDVRHIDWNVSARSSELYTRLYQEEREQLTTVVVDLRPSMFTGSVCLRAVSAGHLAAGVLWQACYAGDRCSAIVISSNGLKSSRPGSGDKGVLRALNLITCEFMACTKKQHSRFAEPSLSDTLALTNQSHQKSNSYFFFSGFDTLDDEQWHKRLPATTLSTNFNAVLLLDPLEIDGLPHNEYHYYTSKKASVTTISATNKAQLLDLLQRNITKRKEQFRHNKIPVIAASTTTKPADLLAELQQRNCL